MKQRILILIILSFASIFICSGSNDGTVVLFKNKAKKLNNLRWEYRGLNANVYIVIVTHRNPKLKAKGEIIPFNDDSKIITFEGVKYEIEDFDENCLKLREEVIN
jgi:hypothetical protein